MFNNEIVNYSHRSLHLKVLYTRTVDNWFLANLQADYNRDVLFEH